MASTLARRAAALALAALLAGPAPAETVALTRAEARVLGARAMAAGDGATAEAVARGLIGEDAGDRDAWLLLAAAEIRLGRPSEAREAAAEAHRLSTTGDDRYEAARIAALAANQEGRHGLAVWWLRRALLVAPGAEEAAQTREDAARVQGQAAWRSSVRLAFTPSGNVNGGSQTPYNIIDGLPFVGLLSIDAQALSGWVGTLDASATRRLAESRTARTELGFHLYGRGVTLSETSRGRIAAGTPEGVAPIGAGDFSYVLTEAALSHQRLVGPALVGATLTGGRAWSGGDPYFDSLKLGGEATLPLAEGRRFVVATSVEQRWYDGSAPPDLPATLSLSWSVPLPDRDRLTLTATVAGTWSDNRNARASSWSAQASYALARPVGPARLTASVGYAEAIYPDYALFFQVPGGRHDERSFATLEAALVGYDVAGFVPVVTLQATSTESNVSRFEAEDLSIGFGFRSSF